MPSDRISMQTIPLIPRKLLFGNPDKAAVQISPDGLHLAYLAPRDGVMNIWVAPRDNPVAAQPVTHDTGRGIPFFLWAYTNQQILYIQDKGGDENWRIYRVDIATAIAQDLTPFESVQARPLKVSRLHPDEIVIALNKRRPECVQVNGSCKIPRAWVCTLQRDLGVHTIV